MKLVMTLLVKDEIDILEDNLTFHFDHGVDHVVAIDNGSTDGTRDLLEEYARAGHLHVIDEPEQNYAQGVWVTRAALAARDVHGADWILNNDADEFWISESGNLKDGLSETTADLIPCERRNMVCSVDMLDSAPWKETLKYFVQERIKKQPLNDLYTDRLPGPMFYLDLMPKSLCRARGLQRVLQGNHSAEFDRPARRGQASITIAHYPLRGRVHIRQKVEAGGRAYARNTELPENFGWQWRRWLRMLEKDGIEAVIQDAFPSAQRFERDLSEGVLKTAPSFQELLMSNS